MRAGDVDAVLLDVGGVLTLPDPAVLGPLLAYYGGDPSHAVHQRAHYGAMAVRSAAGVGEHDWDEYDAEYARLVGVGEGDLPSAAVAMGQTRNPYLWRAPIAGNVAALARLHAAGAALGIVSNASGHVAEILRRSGVCQAGPGPHTPVRVVVDSGEVGFEKPDPRIFHLAIAGLGDIDPARIAYVGDSVTLDVAGARAAGIRGILLDPYDDHPGAPFDRIRSLADLL